MTTFKSETAVTQNDLSSHSKAKSSSLSDSLIHHHDALHWQQAPETLCSPKQQLVPGFCSSSPALDEALPNVPVLLPPPVHML